MSPHSFIRILPSLCCVQPRGSDPAGGLLRDASPGLHVNSFHISRFGGPAFPLSAHSRLLEVRFKDVPAASARVLGFTVIEMCHRQTGGEDFISTRARWDASMKSLACISSELDLLTRDESCDLKSTKYILYLKMLYVCVCYCYIAC